MTWAKEETKFISSAVHVENPTKEINHHQKTKRKARNGDFFLIPDQIRMKFSTEIVLGTRDEQKKTRREKVERR